MVHPLDKFPMSNRTVSDHFHIFETFLHRTAAFSFWFQVSHWSNGEVREGKSLVPGPKPIAWKYEWLSWKTIGGIHIYFYHCSISLELLWQTGFKSNRNYSFTSLESVSVSAQPRGQRFGFFLKISGKDFFWFLPISGGSAYFWLVTASLQPLASTPHTYEHIWTCTHTHVNMHTPHTQYNFKEIFEIKWLRV